MMMYSRESERNEGFINKTAESVWRIGVETNYFRSATSHQYRIYKTIPYWAYLLLLETIITLNEDDILVTSKKRGIKTWYYYEEKYQQSSTVYHPQVGHIY